MQQTAPIHMFLQLPRVPPEQMTNQALRDVLFLADQKSLDDIGMPVMTRNHVDVLQQEDTEQGSKQTDGDPRGIETVTDRWWKVVQLDKK